MSGFLSEIMGGRLGIALIVVCTVLTGFGIYVTYDFERKKSEGYLTYLQDGVFYVTNRRPKNDKTSDAKQPLQWLKKRDGKIIYKAAPLVPKETLGSHLIILIHGYSAQPHQIGTYFKGLIEYLRKDKGFKATFVVYDWPTKAKLVGSGHIWNPPRVPGGSPILQGPSPELKRINQAWEANQLYYFGDKHAAIHLGAPGLIEVIDRVRMLFIPKRLSVVAHSMGSLVVLEAMRKKIEVFRGFSRLILLAPDIPQSALNEPGMQPIVSTIEKIHFYWSKNDSALLLSKTIQKGVDRLGRIGPLRTGLPANVFGHNVTKILTGKKVHEDYVGRLGASKIRLADSF